MMNAPHGLTLQEQHMCSISLAHDIVATRAAQQRTQTGVHTAPALRRGSGWLGGVEALKGTSGVKRAQGTHAGAVGAHASVHATTLASGDEVRHTQQPPPAK